MKLCDLHTHILPGVDDGAPTMEYALQMLHNAQCSDVALLAVTPHCNRQYGAGNYMGPALLEAFEALQRAAASLELKLVLGAEVRVDKNLPELLQLGKLPTLGGGRYLLTEFAPDTEKADFLEPLQQILALGFVPLIAHPERYRAVCSDPEQVTDWLDMGCHLQLTGGSILGEHGKKAQNTSALLLRQGWVACIASDAHGLYTRSNFLLSVYDHIAIRYSRQYADCLLYENPMCICSNYQL